jgi:hypothetical protein
VKGKGTERAPGRGTASGAALSTTFIPLAAAWMPLNEYRHQSYHISEQTRYLSFAFVFSIMCFREQKATNSLILVTEGETEQQNFQHNLDRTCLSFRLRFFSINDLSRQWLTDRWLMRNVRILMIAYIYLPRRHRPPVCCALVSRCLYMLSQISGKLCLMNPVM